MQSIIKKIELPLFEDIEKGWKPYHLFRCTTKSVNLIKNHISVLSPGKTPHPPHVHKDEEILIMISGEADIILGENHERVRLKEGQLTYYPSYYRHTIENTSSRPATYLMYKWLNERKRKQSKKLQQQIFQIDYQTDIDECSKKFKKIFESPTEFLEKIQCHTTVLKPGGGYKPHTDNYDVAILVLEGEVKTVGEAVKPLSSIFYPCGQSHGMKNIGNTDAKYLVFEFHGKATRPTLFKLMRRFTSRITRKIISRNNIL